MAEIVLTPDPFLEAHIGRPAFALRFWEASDVFGPRLRATIGAGRAFVAAKVECADVAAQACLAQAGFYPADVNMTLEMDAHRLPNPSPIARQATTEDRESVMRLAGSNFTCSRFHRDPHISIEAANGFKTAWAGNYFEGKRGDAMIVAEYGGELAGFLQLLVAGEVMIVDLITVSESARGRGVGAAMLARAKVELPACTLLRTGTQAANVASLRFYEKLGFRVTASTAVMHFWKD